MKRAEMTIYYDDSCTLCRAEIDAIKAHDSDGIFALVDCSASDFDERPFRVEGITRSAMMDALHVRDSKGVWYVGVDAFELIYRTIGQSAIAWFWGSSLTRPFTSRLYPWIARNRQLFTWSGIPFLFQCWGKCAARRAHQRSRRCHNGNCSI